MFNQFDAFYNGLDDTKKYEFIEYFVNKCEQKHLFYLTTLIDSYKNDFMKILPIEIIENIFNYLDVESILECCKVSQTWNKKISENCKIWRECCLKYTIVRESEKDAKLKITKETCKSLINRIKNLKSDSTFSVEFDELEVNSINYHNGTFATASNIVKFWKEIDKKFVCFKELNIESRASCFKFNDFYLIVGTYFYTIDIYSINLNKQLLKYQAHTCGITSIDFNQDLALILSTSADNTIKYWFIDMKNDENMSKRLVKSVKNAVWPLNVTIGNVAINENIYTVVSLFSNNQIYFANLIKLNDDTLKFCSNDHILDLNNEFFSIEKICFNLNKTNKNRSRLEVILTVKNSFIQDELSNLLQYYYKEWDLNVNEDDLSIELIEKSKEIDLNFVYPSQNFQISYTVLVFGSRYCLLFDESNRFYLADISNKKCVSNLTRIDCLMPSGTLENHQFCFGNKEWLNGLNLFQNENGFSFAFYTYIKRAVYLLYWKNKKTNNDNN